MGPWACVSIMHIYTSRLYDSGFKQTNRVDGDKDEVFLSVVAMLQQQNDQHNELLYNWT
jgi:hypothetical protein